MVHLCFKKEKQVSWEHSVHNNQKRKRLLFVSSVYLFIILIIFSRSFITIFKSGLYTLYFKICLSPKEIHRHPLY